MSTVCTFAQFQATRQPCADIGAAVNDETMDGRAGLLYLDALYIETGDFPEGDRYCLTIGNYSEAGTDLEAFERMLYDFAVGEGYASHGNEAQTVAMLRDRYAAECEDLEMWEGEKVHASLKFASVADHYDPNTGGNVWNSFTVHPVNGGSSYVVAFATADGLACYRMPEGVDPSEGLAVADWFSDPENDAEAVQL